MSETFSPLIFALYMPIAETASFASASPERMDNVFLNSSGGSELFASFLFSVPIQIGFMCCHSFRPIKDENRVT